ncbi:glycosyltransferase family 2 protein [Wukongibacter sp. M2B1]|uniref:glycosyltransferase family 2 protein n=1 Tax=Wukongibacter sp. M2B1 TaxID=3088895 RepID=UPI003D7AB94E
MWSSVSAIIPVYNSIKSLDELYYRLSEELEKISSKYEIILIDDGSIDKSYEKMRELREKDNRVKIIQLDGNFGQQNAIMCGFHHAQGEYIVTLDDDLQHMPEYIEKLLNKLDEGYDVVYGIAEKKQHSFYRNLGSKITNYLFNKICSKPKDIRVSSFRVIKRDVLIDIIKNDFAFVYISAITLKITKNIGNVCIKHDARKYGNSNYNFAKLLKLFVKLYVYYSNTRFTKIFISSAPQFRIKDKML